jgi:hypothetical protein
MDIVVRKRLRYFLAAAAFEEAMNAHARNPPLQKLLRTLQGPLNASPNGDVRSFSPVLQAECWLRISEGFIDLGNLVQAEGHLATWDTVSPFVENYYLHCLAMKIRSRINERGRDFKLEHEFELPGVEDQDNAPTLLFRRDQFERWMLNSALRRLPKPISWEALGEVYGAKRDAMRRRAKELGIELPEA